MYVTDAVRRPALAPTDEPSSSATTPPGSTPLPPAPYILLHAPPSASATAEGSAERGGRTHAEWMQPSEYRATPAVSRSAETVVDSCVEYMATMWDHLERREERAPEERHPDPIVRFWRRARKVAQVAAMACDKLAHKMERRHQERLQGAAPDEPRNGRHAFAMFAFPPPEWHERLHPTDHEHAHRRLLEALRPPQSPQPPHQVAASVLRLQPSHPSHQLHQLRQLHPSHQLALLSPPGSAPTPITTLVTHAQ